MSKDEQLNELIISVVGLAERLQKEKEGKTDDAKIIQDFLNAAKFKLRKNPPKRPITLLV